MAVYSEGKRAKKRQVKTRNKIIIGILICIIILAIIYLVVSDSSLGLEDLGEMQPIENNVTQTQNNEQEDNVVEEKKDEIVSDVTIPEKIGGYKVDGRLVIPKINVTCDIVHGYDDAALTDKSVGHIAGPELNTPGNFCIVGHRGYQFEDLHTLEKGDTLYTINKETNAKVTYEVTSVFTCGPKDVDHYRQSSDGKRHITIVTCTPTGAKRVVCQACEI